MYNKNKAIYKKYFYLIYKNYIYHYVRNHH